VCIRLSQLDAVVKVLSAAPGGLTPKEVLSAMEDEDRNRLKGKTPWTRVSAFLTAHHKDEFVKMGYGRYAVRGGEAAQAVSSGGTSKEPPPLNLQRGRKKPRK
jgi:hypothetical protein